MKIKETFLQLTQKTYPWGFEHELENLLPRAYEQDYHGNYYYKIGDSNTAFTCHLDTACKNQDNVNHIIEGNLIKTDGKTILGADDKAGMTILLWMIKHNVPGLYCFFIGEEVGCIGSKAASKDPQFLKYDRMISFDRRGTTSVITHQSSKRCCSDKFAIELANQLNQSGLELAPDDTGVYTDSAEFVDVISECTNISVGYLNEHRFSESQDIAYLQNLCQAVLRVDWENLPTARDKTKSEYKDFYTSKKKSLYSGSVTVWDGNRNSNKYAQADWSGDWYYESDNWKDFENSKWKNKKTKKRHKESSFEELSYEDVEVKSKRYYEAIKQYIFDDKLTRAEFERVKSSYLDLNDPGDMDFYLEMKELL
jgi:hypothetical protein